MSALCHGSLTFQVPREPSWPSDGPMLGAKAVRTSGKQIWVWVKPEDAGNHGTWFQMLVSNPFYFGGKPNFDQDVTSKIQDAV